MKELDHVFAIGAHLGQVLGHNVRILLLNQLAEVVEDRPQNIVHVQFFKGLRLVLQLGILQQIGQQRRHVPDRALDELKVIGGILIDMLLESAFEQGAEIAYSSKGLAQVMAGRIGELFEVFIDRLKFAVL